MYKANVEVTLRPSILDPQGKAALQALHNLGFENVDRVRIGKHVELWIKASDQESALNIVTSACEKLLANPVMEDYRVELEPAVADQE